MGEPAKEIWQSSKSELGALGGQKAQSRQPEEMAVAGQDTPSSAGG